MPEEEAEEEEEVEFFLTTTLPRFHRPSVLAPESMVAISKKDLALAAAPSAVAVSRIRTMVSAPVGQAGPRWEGYCARCAAISLFFQQAKVQLGWGLNSAGSPGSVHAQRSCAPLSSLFCGRFIEACLKKTSSRAELSNRSRASRRKYKTGVEMSST